MLFFLFFVVIYIEQCRAAILSLFDGRFEIRQPLDIELFPDCGNLLGAQAANLKEIRQSLRHPGLELGKLESERRSDDGVPVLVIRGEIANPSVGTRDLPPLMASLYDAEGKELRSWRFTAAEKTVPAEQQVLFQTELRDPPDAATDLKISFVAE